MEALVFQEGKVRFARNHPEPKAGADEVLIEVEQAGICATDLEIINGYMDFTGVLGHEFARRVKGGVRELKGKRVVGEINCVCGKCDMCQSGLSSHCRARQVLGIQGRDGAFAEYICIPAKNVWLCDTRIPEDVLAIFDPFGNATHTALSFDLLGEDVLITGAGPIGIMAAAIAKHAGARYVVVTDINQYRLDLAKKMGATRVIDVRKERLKDIQKELNMNEGFDVGLEMSGNGQAFEAMLENMVHGGKIALLGILQPETKINWDLIVFNSLTIKGIYGREMFETWYKATMMIQGGVDLTPLITHRFHYMDYAEGFDVMRSGKSGKVILNWEDE